MDAGYLGRKMGEGFISISFVEIDKSMTKWFVELIGNPKDLQFIAVYLNSSELNIFNEKNSYYLESNKFDPIESSTDIKAIADNLIDILNGAAILYYPRFQRVTYRQIHRVNDDGKRQIFGFLTAQGPTTMYYGFSDDDDTLSEWLEIGQKDDAVARAFTLYGALEHNWKNLYMVLDVIQEDLDREKNQTKQKWLEANKIKLFKRTANSYGAVGKEARHGKTSFKRPKKPMDIRDAQILLDSLLKEWIQHKKRNQRI